MTAQYIKTHNVTSKAVLTQFIVISEYIKILKAIKLNINISQGPRKQKTPQKFSRHFKKLKIVKK